jgi:MFS family permease
MRGLPRTFWYLWAGALINRLGGFVYTFLALYLTTRRHFTVAEAGLVVGLYGAGSFASGPVGGYLADHIGRRRTMLMSFVLGAAAMIQLGFARGPWHIAESALVLGFCSDLYRPAEQATIADIVPPTERTRAYGYVYWAVRGGLRRSSPG